MTHVYYACTSRRTGPLDRLPAHPHRLRTIADLGPTSIKRRLPLTTALLIDLQRKPSARQLGVLQW